MFPALVVLLVIGQHTAHAESNEEWMKIAKDELDKALNKRDYTDVAKNVVLFLGDGLGVSTVTAARIYKGQGQGFPGEETLLEFEKFPNVALSKTYNNDRQTPDSAGTGTAFLCGVKANLGTLGLSSAATRGNCSSAQGAEVTSIVDWAIAEGKSVGLVTTTRVTHATPAAAYAHSPERNWEADISTPDTDGTCKDIALQLIEKKKIQVILGGGRRAFMMASQTDPETHSTYKHRKDQRDLIKEWLFESSLEGQTAKYVWNKQQLAAIDPKDTDYLLGLFEASHMQYDLERDTTPAGDPSIADMTRKAIQILQKNEKGFFLLVEGGRIDHGHHSNSAKKSLHDVVAFDKAVAEANRLVDISDTLTIVTADHSHVFNIGGYPKRGNNILGVVDPSYPNGPDDGMPRTTLVYGNGPLGQNRVNLAEVDTTADYFSQEAAVKMPYETHSGEDVAIYARGPMAHLFHGVHEQHYIAHVMSYSACIGPYKGNCERVTSQASTVQFNVWVWVLLCLVSGSCL
ncbi:alkaline phosphatase-like [Haliotis cracherodii]|uniref:alkaline phosphatase-like n=1 Tax=Haliotis cracherodii TaxID=6455 RepID=UPI0039E8753F